MIKDTNYTDEQREAVGRAWCGECVECTREQYIDGGIRNALGESAARWIDQGQGIHAQIAFMEIKRLDNLFDSA